MARSTRIYVVQGFDGHVINAFTVKHELVRYLKPHAGTPWTTGVTVTATGDNVERKVTDLTVSAEQYLKDHG